MAPTPRRLLGPALAFEGGLALAALVLGWWLGQPPLATLSFNLRDLGIGALATGPMFLGLWVCLASKRPALLEIRELVEELLLPLLAGSSLVGIAGLSALAGLGEEMLFRGVVQPAIAGLFDPSWGPWLGLAGASLLFGLAHAVTRAYVVLAALVGAYLGGLWLLTGNLLVPVVAHALYDFGAILWLLGSGPRQSAVAVATAEPAAPGEGRANGPSGDGSGP
jgi:membrane protease YdiL (CAAX protease family)